MAIAPSKVTWIEGPLMNLSSSDIRAMIGKKRDIKYLVREHVRRFIVRRHLYGA
jgi:nicotinic acid mononucleotide adenylyltransferase